MTDGSGEVELALMEGGTAVYIRGSGKRIILLAGDICCFR